MTPAVTTSMSALPRGSTVRRDAGLYGYERALRRAGLVPIAGVDEAGRGACAGPLVAGAAILPDAKAGIVPGLADSKLLTEKARERCYDQIVRRALAWSVVVIESEECDRLGMHVANVEALRRAVALLDVRPTYVLTDGFPVDGLGRPRPGDVEGRPGGGLHRGRRRCWPRSPATASCASCTSDYPAYDFRTHKGYITDGHAAALLEHGPCAGAPAALRQRPPGGRARAHGWTRTLADLVETTNVGVDAPRGESA